MNNKTDERREYFRVEDDIYLQWHKVSEDEYARAEETLKHLTDDDFSLSADFATLNHKFHPILNNIKQAHPDIAHYLELLNTKLDSLGHHLLQQQEVYDEQKLTHVNISASGMMYATDEPVPVNTLLKLEYVLFPEKVGIITFGKVVNTTLLEDSKHCIHISFEHMRTEDSELMIKHNLNTQMNMIREHKDSMKSSGDK
ncbi:MAG TPA: PilZ domain-containing protein [Gammaproteobacteria bacterium]